MIFKEEEHPRDEDGKFTDKSGSGKSSADRLTEMKKAMDFKNQEAKPQTFTTSNPLELIEHNTPRSPVKGKYDPEDDFWTVEKIKEQEAIDDKHYKTSIARPRSPESDRVATRLMEEAVKAEPEITRTTVEICHKYGGSMVGLNVKIKAFNSLSGKIKSLGGDLEAAGDTIKDNVRYTSVVPASQLARHASNVLREYKSRGYRVIKCDNSYKDGSLYKGINCALVTPKGYTFELQFHTPESINAKECLVEIKRDKWVTGRPDQRLSQHPSHKYYEENRANPTPERRRYLDYRLRKLWSNVDNPTGIDEALEGIKDEKQAQR